MTATEGFPDRHAPYSLAEVSVNCAGAPRHATPRGGGPPAVRAPLPPLECGLARPVRRSHAHVDAARTPGSHGAASRLMTLTSRRGATPQSRGTTPAAASFQEQPSPPPVVTSSPSSLLSAAPASTAQTPLINTLSAEPTRAGRALPRGRHGRSHADTATGLQMLRATARFQRAPGGHRAVTGKRRQN